MKKIILVIALLTIACKKKEPIKCYNVEIEVVTTLHEGHKDFNSYGKDNQTVERVSYITCSNKSIDSLINLGSNVIDGAGFCISYKRVLKKVKKD